MIRQNAVLLTPRLSRWESVGYFVEAPGDEASDTQKLANRYLRRRYAQFKFWLCSTTMAQIERLRAAFGEVEGQDRSRYLGAD